MLVCYCIRNMRVPACNCSVYSEAAGVGTQLLHVCFLSLLYSVTCMPFVKGLTYFVTCCFTAVCSVGELREIGPDDLPYNTTMDALYIVSQPIQYCGALRNVTTNGFYLLGESVPLDTQLQLELKIYQRESDGTYGNGVFRTLTFSPENISDPYGSATQNINMDIIEGDLVSISILSNCNKNQDQYLCPIHPVILPNSAQTTTPAVWYSPNGDINNLTARADVLLNVRVFIGEWGKV